jgi:hypothetical protein
MTAITVKEYAAQNGIQASSVQKSILRKLNLRVSVNDSIPEKFIHSLGNAATDNKDVVISKTDPAAGDRPSMKPETLKKPASSSVALPVASLVICGLVSSYGCFKFLTFFSPLLVCAIGAFAMVSVYVSLCTMKNISEKAEKISKKVSLVAMVVSLMFNISSVAMFAPEPMSEMGWLLFGLLCILRGAPFPVLSYYLSLIIFKLK